MGRLSGCQKSCIQSCSKSCDDHCRVMLMVTDNALRASVSLPILSHMAFRTLYKGFEGNAHAPGSPLGAAHIVSFKRAPMVMMW